MTSLEVRVVNLGKANRALVIENHRLEQENARLRLSLIDAGLPIPRDKRTYADDDNAKRPVVMNTNKTPREKIAYIQMGDRICDRVVEAIRRNGATATIEQIAHAMKVTTQSAHGYVMRAKRAGRVAPGGRVGRKRLYEVIL